MQRKNGKKTFLSVEGKKSLRKGREMTGKESRYAQLQISYNECEHYVWQTCTNNF